MGPKVSSMDWNPCCEGLADTYVQGKTVHVKLTDNGVKIANTIS